MNKDTSTDQSFLDDLYKVIEENLVNEQFGVEELAREMAVSRSQLHRRIHAQTGQSTSQLIREYRLRKAKELLENETATVAEVSYKVGFGSPSYFNTCFSEYFGYPPGEVKIRRSIEQKGIPFITKKNVLISASILTVLVISYFSSIRPANSIALDYKPLIFEEELAILPPENLDEDSTNQYLANGVFESITGHLSKIEDLRVTPTSTVERYRGTTKSASIIGAELGVGRLVKWSFSMIEDQVALFIQLIDTENEDQIFSKEYKSDYDDINTLQSEVAQTIAKNIGVEIPPEVNNRIASTPTQNMNAQKLYWQGNHYRQMGRQGNQRAIRLYRQAIALDPNFAPAYSALGSATFMLGYMFDYLKEDYGDSLVWYARKAIELDSTFAAAYITLGWYYNWISDNESSMYYLNQALIYHPNHPNVYRILGWVYNRMGQPIDAIMSFEKAKKLSLGNPTDISEASSHLGNTYSSMGDFAKAEVIYREVLNVEPVRAYWQLSNLYTIRNEWDKAKYYTDTLCSIDSGQNCLQMLYKYYLHTEDFTKAYQYKALQQETGLELDGWRKYEQAEYGYVLSQLNRKDEAKRYYYSQIEYCQKSLRLKRAWAMEGLADATLFETYVFLGNHDLAIYHLKECEKKAFGWANPSYLKGAPQYQSIWGNEEFKAIIKRQEKKYADIRAKIDQLQKEGKL